jgi:hypothetical protein
LSIEKNALSLAIPWVLQKNSRTYQTLLNRVNENIYRSLWYVGIFIANKFSRISVFLGFAKGDLRATMVMRC